MNKFLYLTISIITCMTGAFAADECCCTKSTYQGLFLGGNFGVASHLSYHNDSNGFLSDHAGGSSLSDGFSGGVRIGYNSVFQNSMIGFVADWNATTNRYRLYDNPNSEDDHFSLAELNWYSTLRARTGITICDSLFYVTGGAAVSNFNLEWNDSSALFGYEETRWGWTGGAGSEFKLTCNLSLGMEFLFIHFTNKSNTCANSQSTSYNFNHCDSAWLGRLTLNYYFGNFGRN